MKSLIFSLALLLFTTGINAQKVPSADQVMQEAYAKAVRENKNVLVMFHASWCGWCHKMDASLNDASVKKMFDDNFVITHLTVDEAKDKKNFENAGAMELRAKWNGTEQGLPYWVVLDKSGNLLADSQIRPAGADAKTKGSNVGCPASQEEVAHFISVLTKTAKLDENQLKVIAERFRANENN
jgi:thiol-disulfide isomerase/thioredoxin